MNATAHLHLGDFSPLEFMISLDRERSFVVRERRGRKGGIFTELSSAILFVREECQMFGCAAVMKFDQSLACIRAAG
ncbi:hypothetical protein [Rhodoblastus sp.]|uniref:hypothetical protein n=1 Tax=Rhodoblastus sp. TaxID=1962975 RepID=UPI0035B19595